MEVPFVQGPTGRATDRETLQLAPGEVVLTFDDGPMPRRTPAVLDALRAECVKATFFVIGTMVAAHPDILRRTAAEGHTIATHTWSHAYLHRTRSAVVQRDQIDGGLLAARAVLGEADPGLSPFFRYPGLGHTRALDRYVNAHHLIPFSIDVDGQDWKRITPAQVVERVMGRLDTLGRGIILLHDIQARTVAILPELLRQLKAKGYRVVHVTGAAEDTRQALTATQAPYSRRIQLALNRLDRQMAVRLARQEAAPEPFSAPAAPTVAGTGSAPTTGGWGASADPDAVGPTPALRGSVASDAPMATGGRFATAMTAAAPIAPIVASAAWIDPPGRSSVGAREAAPPQAAGPTAVTTTQAGPGLSAGVASPVDTAAPSPSALPSAPIASAASARMPGPDRLPTPRSTVAPVGARPVGRAQGPVPADPVASGRLRGGFIVLAVAPEADSGFREVAPRR